MDFRSEVFKLCKAIQKRTETNIVNDTYLRLFTCKSEEYVIPQYSMFHEAAKHGNNQFYGYLYANEHTDDYKTVLQGITPLPDKDIQIFARAHATIYALIKECVKELEISNPKIAKALDPYSKYRPITAPAGVPFLAEKEYEKAAEAFRESKLYKKLINSSINALVEELKPEDMLGFICIFNYYWKKPWGYLDEVIDATQTVYEQNNHTVSLSEPLKELEEQLNQIKMSVLLSKQAAKQAEEKKNEIIMYLAHDIRTPLTTVIGYLSLLHEAPDMPEQQKEKYVKVALNKAERLEKLINELFEITKYNAHTVIIKKETVDLHCLIAQVIDEIYPTLSANGNTAVFTAEDNLSVNADPEKLARVFSNLLRNAASYSYPQTEITISAKRLEHDIQITFENHGKTIPQEQLNSIFEKFNRLDDARLSNTGGAGLGLSIAEEIIHLHGGKITASSQNETIDFVITLPLSA